MDYGSVLRKGWEITWKNKGLWILGILSGCTSGAGNPSQSVSYQTSSQDFPGMEQTFASVPEETWILIVGCLVIFLIVFVLAVIVLSIRGRRG
jgi:hypothetical protein